MRNSLSLFKFKFPKIQKIQKFFCIKAIKDTNDIKQILSQISTPEGKSLIDLGLLHSIKIENETRKIKIQLNLHKDYMKIKHMIEKKLHDVLKLEEGDETKLKQIEISLAPSDTKSKSVNTNSNKPGISKIQNIIAVSSCKGGVGKSTVAVNIAFSLIQQNKKVGIFDADIYGPSLPTMINPSDSTLRSYEDNPQMIIPVEFSGIKAMSFGFAAPGRRAVMRGPIVSNLVTQLVCNTDWGHLDYLIVDMPPGTGDIQISLCQELSFKGGVIVTTPQKLSFIDVVKGIEMFDELKIPILGVVENMSYFMCDNCDKKHHIFGHGYIPMLKNQFGIEDSFTLPIDPLISRMSDSGSPYVLISPESSLGNVIFKQIAKKLISRIESINKLEIPKVEYNKELHIINISVSAENNTITTKKIDPLLLRKKCNCAACIDEFTGEKLLKDKTIPTDVYPKKIEEKGNYAVAIVWSDGHRSSIYPYKRLLSKEIVGE